MLGRLVPVDGAGFLGAKDRPGEATLLRLSGALSSEGASGPFGPVEVVAPFESGERAVLPLELEVKDDALVSSLFQVTRGTFTGTVTPLVLYGTEEVEGASTEVTLTLAGIRQVAVLRFLPGFQDSLHKFGLALARDAIEARVLERLRAIYAEYNVEFVTEAPTDMLSGSWSTIELGGTDPNGLGAFGYDNTPGKDVGNLRLGDSIGGENAAVQVDGAPGYGGVFIESFLWWSGHPELLVAKPGTAPDEDPLFDAIFDPVRGQPATLAEANGQGDPARVAAVERAIRALSYLVAETTAHEFGHSLGLAEPYGAKTRYHNETPGEGCIMDSGFDRPLGERVGEPGYATTLFCGDAPEYLQEILPK